MALHRNVCRLVALTEYSMCKATPHRRCYKKQRYGYILHLYRMKSILLIPLCPLGQVFWRPAGWSLDRAVIKLSTVVRQFQPIYFATKQCRQVCCFAGVVRVIGRDQLRRSSPKWAATGATTLLPSTKYITGYWVLLCRERSTCGAEWTEQHKLSNADFLNNFVV